MLAPHQTGDAIGASPGEAAREVGEFRRSARQALRWLLVGGLGPLLSEVDVPAGPVPARAVAELGRAEKVIYGRSSRRYDVARARGVQHALMWAQYAARPHRRGGRVPIVDPCGARRSRLPVLANFAADDLAGLSRRSDQVRNSQ